MSDPGRAGWEPPDASRPAPPPTPYPHGAYPPPAAGYPPGAYPRGPYPPPAYPGPYPGVGSYPGGGYGGPYPAAAAAGPGLPRPIAVQAVPGTPFGVAVVEVKPTTSGPASASLVVGIASIMVALVAGCFAQVGAEPGWGATVAGAFAVLAGLAALAAIWLWWTAAHRIRRAAGWGAARGRRLAIAGLLCGLVGLAITGLVMLVATLA